MSNQQQADRLQGSISNINLDSIPSDALRRRKKLSSFTHPGILNERVIERKENGENGGGRKDFRRQFCSPFYFSGRRKNSCGKKQMSTIAACYNKDGTSARDCPTNYDFDGGGSHKHRGKNSKPSFSSQLKLIGSIAEQNIADIKEIGFIRASQYERKEPICHEDSDVVLSMPTKCITIGFTSCKYPAPIHFYRDRCEFLFYHPFETSEIYMVVWYRDMISFSFICRKFSFKLLRQLCHFPFDYDPNNPLHHIVVELTCNDALLSVKKCIRSA